MANITEREAPWMSSPPAAANYTNRTLQSFFNPGAGQTFTPQPSVRTMEGGTIAQDTPGWNPFEAPTTIANLFRTQQSGIIDPSIVARQTTSMPAPAVKPQPAAEKAVPQPISIIRGLQNTEYLPTMNERGQVQYVAKKTPEQELASAQAVAGLQKTQSETQKNLRGTGMDEAVRTRLAPMQSLQQVLASPNSTKAQQDAARAEINSIWGDIFKLDFMNRYGIAGVTGQNAGG